MDTRSPRKIQGTSVSPGLAVGPVRIVGAQPKEVPVWSVAASEVQREVARLREALKTASDEMQRRSRIVALQSSERDAQIFEVHRLILSDPGALKQVEGAIRTEHINAEAAVFQFITKLESTLGQRMEGDSVRAYAADLSDPWRAVLEALGQGGLQDLLNQDQDLILAAANLTPHVMTLLGRDRLLAVIAEKGGRFSHAAVLARSFGIPCVVGLPNLLGRMEPGMVVAVDGQRGTVQVNPDPDALQRFQELKAGASARAAVLLAQAPKPAVTSDGVRLLVQANIESLRDLDEFEATHTDGVGLLRTEFLYMERPQLPSEDEQYRLYRRVLEHMHPLPVTLRTLDIGGDKQLASLKTPGESNPALGWRGVRVSLEWQDLLRIQLRAALRAGSGRDLRILLPMVSSVEEVHRARSIFDSVRTALLEQGHEVEADVPVGIMVEVPSAVLCLPELIRHVDFVSVGTNDLVQYLLAVDRDNPWVAKLYQPLHPAVIYALHSVAQTSRAAGKSCAVCGDIAEDPGVATMLLGMGYDKVSVAPSFVPEIKSMLRKVEHADAVRLARDALACTETGQVEAVLSKFRETNRLV